MVFDPTCDYGSADLTIASNLLYWQFSELIKTLIVLSSDAQRQAEVMGYGAICDEMVLDFESYFILPVQGYIDNNWLTGAQLKELKWLEMFFDDRSGDKAPDFWDEALLAENPEWQAVRQQAGKILLLLEMQDVRLELERYVKYDFANGKQIVIESTKTKLVRV